MSAARSPVCQQRDSAMQTQPQQRMMRGSWKGAWDWCAASSEPNGKDDIDCEARSALVDIIVRGSTRPHPPSLALRPSVSFSLLL